MMRDERGPNLPMNLLGMVGTRSTASPYLPEVRDAVERTGVQL